VLSAGICFCTLVPGDGLSGNTVRVSHAGIDITSGKTPDVKVISVPDQVNWAEIRDQVLTRSLQRCELCRVDNYSRNLKTGKHIVLSIIHLDHNLENCDLENLKAVCQWCRHSMLKKHHRAKKIKRQLDLWIAE
jgi:hypothetical protein